MSSPDKAHQLELTIAPWPATARSVTLRAKHALAQTWKRARPEALVDEQGYVSRIEANLLDGVTVDMFQEELAAGDGDELAWKVRAVHSSSALVVNTFARWKQCPEHLLLAGRRGFDWLKLEAKCPVVPGRRPAHLDAIAEAEGEVVGVEAKLLEPLGAKPAVFAPAYDTLSGRVGPSRWFDLVSGLRQTPRQFQSLDAAQLVKHVLGLRQRYPHRKVTLLFLFWEPTNAAQFTIYAKHRMEINELARAVSGDEVRFVAQSCADLWTSWTGLEQPAWLADHLDRLISRYRVAI